MSEKSILEMVGGEKHINPHYNIKAEKKGVTMFEKEAEEIANKHCRENMCFGHCSFSSPKHHRCGEWHREYNCAKEGIEFGYNKANEWHYVKDGDLPKPTTPVLVILESGVPYVSWISSDKGWWFCTNYYTGEDKVIAWKEIVLPKESE